MLSRSPQRYWFQSQRYRDIIDKDPSDEDAKGMVRMYDELAGKELVREADPDWAKDNLEYDLRTTDWILEKARESRIYAQNLYAAMCNQDFIRNDIWPLLQDKRWGCSWRHSGGIVADMRQEGDYINWYCSGISDGTEMDPLEFNELTHDRQIAYKESQAYVPEGLVTEEIRTDLIKLGWILAEQADDFDK